MKLLIIVLVVLAGLAIQAGIAWLGWWILTDKAEMSIDPWLYVLGAFCFFSLVTAAGNGRRS